MKWAWRLETLEGQIIAAGETSYGRDKVLALATQALERMEDTYRVQRLSGIPGAVIRLERRP